MWRTIFVSKGQRLFVKDSQLIIYENEKKETSIPISDIYALVIDNMETSITITAIEELTKKNVVVLFCDERHLPHTIMLPLNGHFHPYGVLKTQIEMPAFFKNKLWQKIVQGKIHNQALALKYAIGDVDLFDKMCKFQDEVESGDTGNREGIAAKLFFRNMFGSEFVRTNDSAINTALNYGYSIIRSAVSRSICAYGYNACLGIHHINEGDAFNLSEDLMEPFRPVIDLWVDNNHLFLQEDLKPMQKREIVNILNNVILIDKKEMKIHNAIDCYIKSFSSSVKSNNANNLKLPVLLPLSENNLMED